MKRLTLVPRICVYCGAPAPGDPCPRCWELERRMERDPGLAGRILEAVKARSSAPDPEAA